MSDTTKHNVIHGVFYKLLPSGVLKFNPKVYTWHIPKKLRGKINKHDAVLVETQTGYAKILVTGFSYLSDDEQATITCRVVAKLKNQ